MHAVIKTFEKTICVETQHVPINAVKVSFMIKGSRVVKCITIDIDWDLQTN